MRKTLLYLVAFGPIAAIAQQSGSLDITFGNTGIASIDFATNHDDRGQCVLVQPDGRILMAGGSHQGNGVRFAIARLMPNGTLDNTFGTSGRATAQLGSPPNLDDIIY
ncbi:MAG TPA: delta-60 repeat domain-containing protein, partial [Flavobacteriales bacterium]|nr:delta-60 repeat domain-containing protein [Flavobacteriales bacterium]